MRKFLLKTKIIATLVLVLFTAIATVQPVAAQCNTGAEEQVPAGTAGSVRKGSVYCKPYCDPATEQLVSIGFPGAVQRGPAYCVPINTGGDINNNPIIIMLKGFVQFLAAGVGLAVVGGIIYGGIVYMTARANPGQIQKAEGIIRSAVIGLLLYIFMFALLNFLIPGGILT